MEELIPNKVYKISKSIDGHKIGTEVIFKWWSGNADTRRWAIVSPVGEPDTQSMFGVSREELEDAT